MITKWNDLLIFRVTTLDNSIIEKNKKSKIMSTSFDLDHLLDQKLPLDSSLMKSSNVCSGPLRF